MHPICFYLRPIDCCQRCSHVDAPRSSPSHCRQPSQPRLFFPQLQLIAESKTRGSLMRSPFAFQSRFVTCRHLNSCKGCVASCVNGAIQLPRRLKSLNPNPKTKFSHFFVMDYKKGVKKIVNVNAYNDCSRF